MAVATKKTNASPRAARAGYMIYRRVNGQITGDELNEQLGIAGYGPVADRTLKHYQNLSSAGFTNYISINRFDVARAASRYEDLGANPRYRNEGPQAEGVRLLIAKPGRFWAAPTRVESIGESGAILRLVDDEYTEALKSARVRSGELVTMRFLESGREVEGRIVEVDTESSPATIEVQFGFVHSLAELTSAEPLPSARLGLRLVSEDDNTGATTDQLGRRIYLLFELIDEYRSLVNWSLQTSADSRYAAPAVVNRLSVASPAEVQLIISEVTKALFSAGSVGTLITFIYKFPQLRKTWYEATGAKLDNEAKRIDLKSKDLLVQEQVAEAERRQLERGVVDEVVARLQEEPEIGDDTSERARSIVEQRITPLLAAMAEAGVQYIEEIAVKD